MGAARRLGARLKAGLEACGPRVREVRGEGLLLGLQLDEPAAPVITALQQAGVLTIGGGGETIRFLPPLVITEAQVDEVVSRVAAVLEEA